MVSFLCTVSVRPTYHISKKYLQYIYHRYHLKSEIMGFVSKQRYRQYFLRYDKLDVPDLSYIMVLISDDNSEIGAHVWSEDGNLVYSRHLLGSTAVANLKFLSEKICFPVQHILS